MSGVSTHNSRSTQENILSSSHVMSVAFSLFPDVRVSVHCRQRTPVLGDFNQATFRTRQAFAQPPEHKDDVRNVQTATFQKHQSQQEALDEWARMAHQISHLQRFLPHAPLPPQTVTTTPCG